MRRLLITLVVLIGLLVVADRVAVTAAQRDVARRIQVDQHLQSQPDVKIGGFPFLTQLIGGTYDDVTVSVGDLTSGQLDISSLRVQLRGVHVSFGDVISQHISRVPVDRAAARVVLSYADLNDWLGASKGLRVEPAAGGQVRVTTGTNNDSNLGLSGTARPSVRGDSVVLTVAGSAEVEIPLSGLPFGMQLNAVKATQEGIIVSATANGLVLQP
ncbi:MAG: hypothetical protein QOJ03_3144 [Frankiaceae bacterium]|nr:hypothetical protein [Frankiaceae bacterium]